MIKRTRLRWLVYMALSLITAVCTMSFLVAWPEGFSAVWRFAFVLMWAACSLCFYFLQTEASLKQVVGPLALYLALLMVLTELTQQFPFWRESPYSSPFEQVGWIPSFNVWTPLTALGAVPLAWVGWWLIARQPGNANSSGLAFTLAMTASFIGMLWVLGSSLGQKPQELVEGPTIPPTYQSPRLWVSNAKDFNIDIDYARDDSDGEPAWANDASRPGNILRLGVSYKGKLNSELPVRVVVVTSGEQTRFSSLDVMEPIPAPGQRTVTLQQLTPPVPGRVTPQGCRINDVEPEAEPDDEGPFHVLLAEMVPATDETFDGSANIELRGPEVATRHGERADVNLAVPAIQFQRTTAEECWLGGSPIFSGGLWGSQRGEASIAQLVAPANSQVSDAYGAKISRTETGAVFDLSWNWKFRTSEEAQFVGATYSITSDSLRYLHNLSMFLAAVLAGVTTSLLIALVDRGRNHPNDPIGSLLGEQGPKGPTVPRKTSSSLPLPRRKPRRLRRPQVRP